MDGLFKFVKWLELPQWLSRWGKVRTPTPALVDYFHFDLLFSLQPGDDDFKKTIFKLSDASGHLELEDQGIFSKGKLDSNDGKEMLLFKLVS